MSKLLGVGVGELVLRDGGGVEGLPGAPGL